MTTLSAPLLYRTMGLLFSVAGGEFQVPQPPVTPVLSTFIGVLKFTVNPPPVILPTLPLSELMFIMLVEEVYDATGCGITVIVFARAGIIAVNVTNAPARAGTVIERLNIFPPLKSKTVNVVTRTNYCT